MVKDNTVIVVSPGLTVGDAVTPGVLVCIVEIVVDVAMRDDHVELGIKVGDGFNVDMFEGVIPVIWQAERNRVNSIK